MDPSGCSTERHPCRGTAARRERPRMGSDERVAQPRFRHAHVSAAWPSPLCSRPGRCRPAATAPPRLDVPPARGGQAGGDLSRDPPAAGRHQGQPVHRRSADARHRHGDARARRDQPHAFPCPARHPGWQQARHRCGTGPAGGRRRRRPSRCGRSSRRPVPRQPRSSPCTTSTRVSRSAPMPAGSRRSLRCPASRRSTHAAQAPAQRQHRPADQRPGSLGKRCRCRHRYGRHHRRHRHRHRLHPRRLRRHRHGRRVQGRPRRRRRADVDRAHPRLPVGQGRGRLGLRRRQVRRRAPTAATPSLSPTPTRSTARATAATSPAARQDSVSPPPVPTYPGPYTSARPVQLAADRPRRRPGRQAVRPAGLRLLRRHQRGLARARLGRRPQR